MPKRFAWSTPAELSKRLRVITQRGGDSVEEMAWPSVLDALRNLTKTLACDGCIDSALTGHGFGCGFTFVRVPDGLAGN